MSVHFTTFEQLLLKSHETRQDIAVIFSVFASAEQEKRYKNLIRQTRDVSLFEHDGRYYKVNKTYAILKFIYDNPQPEDFSVWLQQNFEEYKPA